MIKNFIFEVYLLLSDFVCRKSQSQLKLAKKITHFKIQFRKKNLTHLTNVTSLSIIKNILPQYSQKHAFGWCQKKHLHCTISRRPTTVFFGHLESKCFYIPVNLRLKVFASEM